MRRRLVANLRDDRPVWDPPAWVLDEIRAALPDDWELVAVERAASGRGDGGGVSEEALEAVRGAEVYLGYGFPPELFRAGCTGPGARLRWVHSGAAGVASALYPDMVESPLLFTNSAGIHAEPMAETVLAMVLHFARGLDLAVRAQRERRWGAADFEAADTPVRELTDATLGILGFGGIGRAVARRAAALGMRVLATKRTPAEAPDGVRLLPGEGGVREVLRFSDFVVLTLPETSATRGVIDAEALQSMRPGATLINVGRGGLVDESALVEHLRAGRLRGAALDVFRTEPLPPESPLWDLPNVLVTPHTSATTRGFWRREVDLILDNLHRFLSERPLRNLVDKNAGY